MKADILTLCDSAQDYNGRMAIVGTFTAFKAVQFPVMRQMSLAARLCFDPEEAGTIRFKLEMIQPDNQSVILLPEQTGPIVQSGKKSYLNICFNLGTIPFSQAGTYAIRLTVNETTFTTDFEIEQ